MGSDKIHARMSIRDLTGLITISESFVEWMGTNALNRIILEVTTIEKTINYNRASPFSS
jgi:hypothetical protein